MQPHWKTHHRLCDGVGSNFAPCDEVASQGSLYLEPYSCHVTLRSRRQVEHCAGKLKPWNTLGVLGTPSGKPMPLKWSLLSSTMQLLYQPKGLLTLFTIPITDCFLILSASQVLLTWLPSYMKPFFNCRSASLTRMGDLCGFLESASKRSL